MAARLSVDDVVVELADLVSNGHSHGVALGRCHIQGVAYDVCIKQCKKTRYEMRHEIRCCQHTSTTSKYHIKRCAWFHDHVESEITKITTGSQAGQWLVRASHSLVPS